MEPIRIPALHCPVEPEISPFTDAAIQQVSDWIARFQLVTPERLAHYRSQGFVHMTARFYPKTSLDRLVVLAKFYTLLFISDDELDHAASLKSQKHWQNFAREFMSVISGKSHYSAGSGNAALEALTDCWTEMRSMSTVIWQRQFANGLRQMYQAALWENANLQAGNAITVSEYIQLRQYLGAANIATEAIAFAYPSLAVPPGLLALPEVALMTDICRNTICWANDLFSLAKELEHGGVHNLVLLLQSERRISLEHAITETARKHDQDVTDFFMIWKRLSTDASLKRELEQYTVCLLNLMRGNIDWSTLETTRYYGFDYASTGFKINQVRSIN